MRFVRMMMALVVALSVAALPLAGATALGLKPAETAISAGTGAGMQAAVSDGSGAMHAHMHMADSEAPAMDECCPDQAGHGEQGKAHCQSMVACAQCFVMSDIAVSDYRHPALRKALLPVRAEQAAPLDGGVPPFRPPRA